MSTTTTLTDSQRAQLHQLLEQRKAQLLAELGDIQRDTLAAAAGQDGTEAPEDPRDQADRLAHHTVRDAEATRDHDELVAVRAALARWADGSLGECTDCGQPVGVARLLAQPAAARCIACQSKAERAAH
jgi:RNA polymerase-binding transcription factor DksA